MGTLGALGTLRRWLWRLLLDSSALGEFAHRRSTLGFLALGGLAPRGLWGIGSWDSGITQILQIPLFWRIDPGKIGSRDSGITQMLQIPLFWGIDPRKIGSWGGSLLVIRPFRDRLWLFGLGGIALALLLFRPLRLAFCSSALRETRSRFFSLWGTLSFSRFFFSVFRFFYP